MTSVSYPRTRYAINENRPSQPKGKQLCITVHPINNNICDVDPLENSSSKAQINLHCLT